MDLNLRPAAYKAAALPTELWGQSEWLSPSRLSDLIHAADDVMVEGPEVIPAGWSIATYPRLSGPGSFPELHV